MTHIPEQYQRFLKQKIKLAQNSGFEPRPEELHPSGKPHQRDIISWALKHGRALIAASFGLGKTHILSDIARLVHLRTNAPFLIVLPLGVKPQFEQEDGPRMGIGFQYVRTDAEIELAETPFLLTNYERVRDGDIAPDKHGLGGVGFDEGSVFRSLGSKTYGVFERLFANVPYRYISTATPSPNEYRELIYYARILGVMDTGQALTRWFKRDSAKAGNLTLHPHHEKDFWLWVASWAIFVYKPSDLGHSDEGYELPPLNVYWHKIPVDHTRAWEQTDNRGQRRLLLDAAASLPAAAAEKRATMQARLDKGLEILNNEPDDHWLVWHHLEDERRLIEDTIPQTVTVYGSQDLEVRENYIMGFSRGEFPILATKLEIAGSGCNFQRHCHKNIFLGINHKFEEFIQGMHRTYRFQQQYPVDAHIIYAESEEEIAQVLQRKWAQHDELTLKMQEIVQKYGLSHEAMKRDLSRKIGVERMVEVGHRFTAVHNDCVLELPLLADNSIGLIHTSIPFGNHYEYSVQYEDFGHNPTDEDFFKQMDYLIPELLRVLKPGRVAAIHVKDRILYGHQTASGFMEVSPFSDETVMAFRKHGFMYEGRRTIVTDVVRENSSTYRLGWTEMTNDASKMGSGLPEYLLLFRKPPTSTDTARADEPVTKDKAQYTRARWQVDAHSLWRSSGNRLLTPDELGQMIPDRVADMWQMEQGQTVYNHERHVAICEILDGRGHLPSSFMLLPPKVTECEDDPVWDDIAYMRTLNSEQSRSRQENHICPLPLDIVERTIRLYSNEGDLVLDPFGGLMTVPYMAILMNRRAYGIELSSDYFGFGVKYCREAEQRVLTPTLFDFLAQMQERQKVEEVVA